MKIRGRRMHDEECKITPRIEQDAEMLYFGLCQILKAFGQKPNGTLDLGQPLDRKRIPRRLLEHG